MLENVIGSGVQVLDTDINGMLYGTYHLDSLDALALETEAVVNGEDRIAIVIELLYPLLIMRLVPVSAHESAAEGEDYGRFLLAVNLSRTAWGCLVIIQEQVTGVPVGKHVSRSRLSQRDILCCPFVLFGSIHRH